MIDTLAEKDILAARGVADLTFFCKEVLGLANPKNSKARRGKGVWWDDAIHGWLCEWLQKELTDWQIRRASGTTERTYLAAVIPRGCGKSQIITQGAATWLELRMPHLCGYIGNESLELAESFLGGIKAHYVSKEPWHLFEALYGDWHTKAAKWTSDSIEHAARVSSSKDPSFGTFSPTSSLTGRHPDFIIMDDLVSYDALSRKTDWFSFAYGAMTDLIPVVEPNGLVILVGTRYGDGDPFGRSFKESSDGIMTVSGHTHGPYVPTPGGIWRVFFLDARNEDGSPAIPTCWPENEMVRYARRDPVKYASQVRNNPNAHGLNSITEDQFNTLLISEDDLPKRLTISIHVDTAFKHESRKLNDSETVAVVAAHPHDGSGRVFILDVHHSSRWRAEMFGDVLIRACQKAKAMGAEVMGITDEKLPTGKDGLFAAWLSNYFLDNKMTMPPIINLNRGNGESKDVRISEAIAFVVRGHVKFVRTMGGLAELRDQLTNHPYSARKDIADAFADIFHPYFYQQRLPAVVAEPYRPGAYEEALKKKRFWEYDTIPEKSNVRPPLGGSGRRPPAR